MFFANLPEYFKPYVEELFATAQDVYDRPYVPYGSEIVTDSEGNVYYEVDNLAQEVIFMETTNPSALEDGVRSIP